MNVSGASPETTRIAEVPHRPIIIPAEVKTEPTDDVGAEAGETLADIESALAEAVGQKDISPNTTAANELGDHGSTAAVVRIESEPLSTTESTAGTAACETVTNIESALAEAVGQKEAAPSTPVKELSDHGSTAAVARIKSEPLSTAESTANTSQETLQNAAVTVSSAAAEPLQTTSTTCIAAEEPQTNVKTEPTAAEDGIEIVPDSFFDDLLQSADEIQAATLSPNDSSVAANETNAAPVLVEQEKSDAVMTPAAVVTQEKESEAGGNVNTNAEAEADAEADAEEEAIPQDFFDDLLVDRVAERVENAVNEDLEVKFSERLKELNELTELEKRKAHKKKKKKKSQKRSRSKSTERGGHKRRRSRSRSRSPSNGHRQRIRIKSEFSVEEMDETAQRTGSLFPHEQPTSSSRARLPLRVKAEFCTPAAREVIDVDELCLPVQSNEIFTRRNMDGLIIDETTPLGFTRIKLEKGTNDAVPAFKEAPLESLTPQAKRKRAMQRAIAAIEEFKKAPQRKDNLLSTFLYTSTVRKLPTNRSYVTQQIYDNRSPLHTVNNVSFKFNSNATRLNLREWGLEALPSVAATVAKILGYDAHTLYSKLQTIKLPPKLQRIMREHTKDCGEDVEEVHSSYFTNAMTQTDEVTILSGKRHNGYDIGVQANPYTSSIGTQTTESASPSSGSYDNSPLMQQIRLLNENQLLAISDFAELISKPATNAMEMYVVLKRIQDIYKLSQMPSALPPREVAVSHQSPSSFSYESAPQQQSHIPRDPRQHTIQQPARTLPHQMNPSQHQSHSRQRPPQIPQQSRYPMQQQLHPARHSHHGPASEHHQAVGRPPPSGSYAAEPYPQGHVTYNAHATEVHQPAAPYTHNAAKPAPKLYGRGAKRF